MGRENPECNYIIHHVVRKCKGVVGGCGKVGGAYGGAEGVAEKARVV